MITTKPYPDIELAFDEEDHIFYVNDVEVDLSVTGATGIINKSEALMRWATKVAAEDLVERVKAGEDLTPKQIWRSATKYNRDRDDASVVGKDVHKWAEKYLKGNKPDMPDDETKVQAITAFMRWLDDNDLQVGHDHIEKPVYSKKHKYAGILDVAGKVNKKSAIVDLKTSSGFYPGMVLQTSGYKIALEEMGFGPYEERWLIRFDKETGYPEAKKFTDHKRHKELFLHALNLKRGVIELESLIKKGSTKKKKVVKI